MKATQNKWMRAEPVRQVYEQGHIFHADVFPVLEEQMTQFTKAGLDHDDMLDAMVWALTELGFTQQQFLFDTDSWSVL